MATTPLHRYTIPQPSTAINRIQIFFHFIVVAALLYYRVSNLPLLGGGDAYFPALAWWLLTIAELSFTMTWFCAQAFRWRPVIREVHPENIPGNTEFPGIDVFICTTDPKKEPTVDVMNTVLSAMALDYPTEKLAVYLSDDGGSALSLYATREVCSFARSWIPFCRKYKIKTRAPMAYFSPSGDEERLSWSDEFREEEMEIKSMYEQFKDNVKNARESGKIVDSVVHDRAPHVEVMHDNRMDEEKNELLKLPTLVYVSREKRPFRPHRYKAGALNTLLRVSGITSRAPYILVLDCDMFCNDPTSAKQAMCLYLDPKISHSLAFVQYPQMFHNLSKNDIYDGQSRGAYKNKWHGMDGIQGPVLTGTGYYLKRKALYGSPNHQEDECLLEKDADREKEFLNDKVLEKSRNLASCTFEENSNWGKQIGYTYESLLESTFTGYFLHCRGWRSVYLYPERPAFLGCAPVDMKDAATQMMKWMSGLFLVGLSKLNPITYGMKRMHFLQCLCYSLFTYHPLYTLAFLLYATIPQLCFLKGVPVYPKVSDPWVAVFAIAYGSSLFEHMYEVYWTGGSILREWWNEHRIWIIISLTGILFGGLDAIVKLLGMQKESFRLTNKAIDDEKLRKYEEGRFDFKGAELFGVPLVIVGIWDIVCFIGGIKRLMIDMNLEEMFVQFAVSSFFIFLYFSIAGGMIKAKAK